MNSVLCSSLLIVAVALAGCATEPQTTEVTASTTPTAIPSKDAIELLTGELQGPLQRPQTEFADYVEAMAEELVGTMVRRCFKPMAVASFVDIETLNTNSPLGMALSENFITQMQQQGCKVVDFKLRNSIQITSSGDFAFSRNFNQLKEDLAIVYVLTGTLQPMNDGVQINARLVEISSKVVVGSAQRFIPDSMLHELSPKKTRDGVPLLKQG